MKKVRAGGGWPAISYTWQKSKEAGGARKLWRAMRTKNACKTCALGMGGQLGGMVNETGHFPEFCKKSLQAMVADMQGAISPDFWDRYSAEQLKSFTPRELESCGRLVQPVRYTQNSGRFHPIGWDEAFGRIASKLAEVQPNETFWYASGRSSNEAGFLLQLFARLYGTNNVNNCSYYCHQASGVGLASVIGSGTATVVLDDLEQSDLVFAIGCNPASNHPRLMRSFMQVRRRGGAVVVVNPIRETGLVRFNVPSDPRSLFLGSPIASQYIQPHIGGDFALLTGIAKRVVEMGAHDERFLTEHCTGWPELKEHLEERSWEEVTKKSGVTKSEIDEVARRYASAHKVIFSWAMGITHHSHGVHNVQAIANLALLRGMVGKPGAGLMPIRGHSNVQGIGSIGFTPKLKDAIFARLERQFEVSLPTEVGRDTMACMDGAATGELKMGFCLGGNLFGSNPDADSASRALNNLDHMVYLSTTLNTGHTWGLASDTIILPVLARDEEPQPTTQESMFNYVRLSDGGPRRLAGPRSEVDVIATIAEKVLEAPELDGRRGDRRNTPRYPIDWDSMRQTHHIRTAIAQVVPGFEAMADIDNTKQEFQIGGRTFHRPKFAMPDGRARLHVHDLPDLAIDVNSDDFRINLMTIRSEGQFNTVVYEEHDLYRGVEGRDVILLHPDDLERLGITDGERVTVRGPGGEMSGIRSTAFDQIKPGNGAMYFPEANRLLDRSIDSKSRTPAFKGVPVVVRKMSHTS